MKFLKENKIEDLNEIRDEMKERRDRKIKSYKKYALLKNEDIIDTSKLDDWAVKKSCVDCNCTTEQLMDALNESIQLNEDDTLKDIAQAASELDAHKKASTKGQIESMLDWALDYNEEQQETGKNNFKNVLLIGEAGTGKTSIVRQWAKDNNINLYEVRAAGMDATDLGGAMTPSEDRTVVTRLASTEFDKLDRPNSVLFLDEYNRAPKSVRTNLLELVNSHVVPDPRSESGQRFLSNFLFTVAAINPANSNYDTDTMDMAEKTRFRNISVVPDPKHLLQYLEKTFQYAADNASSEARKKRALSRINLAQALLNNKEFEFDDAQDIQKVSDEGNGLALNYRTLTNVLESSDGTKDNLLEIWNEYCNNFKKPMIERILKNYKDIDDKANSVLKSKSDSSVFNRSSNLEKVQSILAKYGS